MRLVLSSLNHISMSNLNLRLLAGVHQLLGNSTGPRYSLLQFNEQVFFHHTVNLG